MAWRTSRSHRSPISGFASFASFASFVTMPVAAEGTRGPSLEAQPSLRVLYPRNAYAWPFSAMVVQ